MATGSVLNGVFKLSLDGKAAPPALIAAVRTMVVEQRLNLPASCTVTLDPDDYAASGRPLDLGRFQLGQSMTAQLGQSDPKPVFSGQIGALEPILAPSVRTYEITGYDALFKMSFGTRMRTFLNMPDSKMVQQVVTEAGFRPNVESTTAVYPYAMQNNVSDFHFILSRAERLGFELFASDQTITFRAGRQGGASVVSLEYGVGLIAFRARMRALTQGAKVTRTGWDPKAKRAISATVSSGRPNDRMGGRQTGFEASSKFGSSAVAAPDGSVVDTRIAESLARGVFERDLGAFVEGEAECAGNPALKPGVNITLANIGGRFDGLYYVTGATHRFDSEEGYATHLDLRRTGL